MTPAGVVTLYAGASGPGSGLGSADGVRSEARFFAPAGLALDEAGNLFVVTDNDGVDDSSGETQFFAFGPLPR